MTIDKKAAIFSSAFENQTDIKTQFTIEQIQFVRHFLEAQSYDPAQINVNTPVISDQLDQNIDERSFKLLANKEESEIKDLLEVAEELQITQLREVLVACLGCMYFIADRETYIQKFKLKNNIEWELTEEDVNEIIAETEAVFFELYNVQNGQSDGQDQEEKKIE